MEEQIQREEDLSDEIEKALQKGRKRVQSDSFINNIVQRASHRVFRFVRWLRNHLQNKRLYQEAIARLAKLYTQQI